MLGYSVLKRISSPSRMLFAVSILSSVLSSGHAFGEPVGQGATTLTCIDKDADGYGTGPGCTSVDADDGDASVITSADAIGKYGTLDAFLAHLGYAPLRKWYVSTTGNDSTCAVNNINLPCATGDRIKPLLKAGDMVLYREGTHTARIINTYNGSTIQGTQSNPIVYLAYPGEKVKIINAGPVELSYSNWVTVDGFEMSSPTTLGYGISFAVDSGISIRNNYLHHYGTIIHNGGQGASIVIENNVTHNSYGEHCIYLGNHWDTPSKDVFVKNNLIYQCATTGFQFNGPVTNLQFDNNIVYNTTLSPISLLMGVSNSYFRNNLTFNSDRSAVTFYDYNGNCTATGTQYICPMPMTGNLFQNNTFWVGMYTSNWQQKAPYPSAVRVGNQPGILFSDSSTSAVVPAHYAAPHDFGGNIFRNNIIVTQEAAAIQFFWGAGLDTTVMQNNLFYRGDGNSTVVAYGGVQPTAGTVAKYSIAQLQSMYPANISGNAFSNPKFLALDTAWWSTPEKFNFNISSSPAVGIGFAPMTPPTDLKGLQRSTPPTAGAYEPSLPLSPKKLRRR